ncbi:hypothetical protein [Paraburkholderia tropica]|uniref:hypothetical protein n=1 Tax=Paraburkholderia tropica TaxID=92647 RepID=UPI003D26FD10
MKIIEKRDSLEGLSVSHNGESIERLTKSRIWLWNDGRKAIHKSDVIEENPLRVIFPGARILSLSVLDYSDGAIKFRSKDLGDGSWQIEFGHWEAKHGVVLEALHTSNRFLPTLAGSVNGLQPIHSIGLIELGSFLPKRTRTFRRWVPALAVLFFAAGVWAIIRFNLLMQPRSIAALLLLLAPGEFLMVLTASFWLNALSVPRKLRRLDGSNRPNNKQ